MSAESSLRTALEHMPQRKPGAREPLTVEERARTGPRGCACDVGPPAKGRLNMQQQNGFHHEFESVDCMDRGTNRRLGNGLDGDDERNAVLVHVRFRL